MKKLLGILFMFCAIFEPMSPYIIIPPGADVHIDGISSGAGTDITATLAGYLATIR